MSIKASSPWTLGVQVFLGWEVVGGSVSCTFKTRKTHHQKVPQTQLISRGKDGAQWRGSDLVTGTQTRTGPN